MEGVDVNNFKKIARVATILTFTNFASAGFGQDIYPNPMCGQQHTAESIVGIYSVEITDTLAIAPGSGSRNLEDKPPIDATIYLFDGQLVLQSDALTTDLRLADENEPNWVLEAPDYFQLGSRDLETFHGCPNSDMPRLIGTGFLTTAEGSQVEYTLRLFTVLTDWEGQVETFSGSMIFSSGDITIKQAVWMNLVD